MREYELNFIIQPEISEEGSQAILDRLDAILDGSQAFRLLCDDLGKRKLAYEVRKFQKGHYYILSFLANKGPGLQLHVITAMIQLLVRITKLGWFDEGHGHRKLVVKADA